MPVDSSLLYDILLARGHKSKSQTNEQTHTQKQTKTAGIGHVFMPLDFIYGKMFLGILDGLKNFLHRTILPLPHVSTTKSSVIFGCLLNPRPHVFWMRWSWKYSVGNALQNHWFVILSPMSPFWSVLAGVSKLPFLLFLGPKIQGLISWMTGMWFTFFLWGIYLDLGESQWYQKILNGSFQSEKIRRIHKEKYMCMP